MLGTMISIVCYTIEDEVAENSNCGRTELASIKAPIDDAQLILGVEIEGYP